MTYTTISLIEAELRSDDITASTTPSSDEVTTWIEETDDIIDVSAGQTFSSTIASSSTFDYDGSGMLRLPETPVISVDEVMYNSANITATSASYLELEEGQGKNFISYLSEGEIVFINGNNATNTIIPKSGPQKLTVSYTYGYATVPKEIQRLATLMVSKRVILSLLNSQANTEGGEVQVGPIAVKDPTSFSINQIEALNSEITDLKNTIGQGFKTFRLTRSYNI